MLKAASVGDVHGVALRGVSGSPSCCRRGLVRLHHRRYHQPSLVVATKLALLAGDDLVGGGAGIPAREQPSAHSLRSSFVNQILEVIIGSV